MSRTTVSDKANWAVELEFADAASPTEYYAVEQLSADDKCIRFRTTRGQELEFDRNSVRKVLLMRTLTGVKGS